MSIPMGLRMKTPAEYANEPMTDHDWLQLEQCVSCGGSGKITEWPHLRIAIAKVMKLREKCENLTLLFQTEQQRLVGANDWAMGRETELAKANEEIARLKAKTFRGGSV